jgi:hypothetical protein
VAQVQIGGTADAKEAGVHGSDFGCVAFWVTSEDGAARVTHAGVLKQAIEAGATNARLVYCEDLANTGRDVEKVKLELMLAGASGVEVVGQAGGLVELTGVCGEWDASATATSALPRHGAVAGAGSAKSKWVLAAEEADVDDLGGGGGLEDEDALLMDDVVMTGPEVAAASGTDCSTKPRACKNCSCGRAEAEAEADRAAVKLTEEEVKDFSSSCGNCFKGDAFRCASCPFRGAPAFEAGQEDKVLLSMADDL